MHATSSVVLLWVALLTGNATAQGREAPGNGTRRISLGPSDAGAPVAVAVSPGLSTVFLFDSELEQEALELDNPRGFSIVDLGRMTLRVVPSAQMTSGEKLRVSVRFRDGAAPPGVSFVLTVHPGHADSHIEVYREARTIESYQQEAKDARAETLRCEEEKSRLMLEHRAPGGLMGLLALGGIDAAGVTGQDVTKTISSDAKNALRPFIVQSYRAMGRVALEVHLTGLRSDQPWTASGASLRGPPGIELRVLRIWQESPIVSGNDGRVLLEAEATAGAARGAFTLKLWESTGPRTVTIGNVTFP